MNSQQAIKRILNKKWLIFWLVLFGAVLAFDLSVIQTPQYRASSKVLVIQKQTQGQDIYTVSKSAQYLSRTLKESIYSDSFFEQVLASSDKISESDFPIAVKERRKAWKRNVKVNILQDLGIMEIDVFNPSPDKIEDINQVITNVLVSRHQDYHGAGTNVEIKILNYPLVSQRPVKPILWLNTVIGAMLGFLIALGLAVRKPKPKEISSLDRRSFSVPRGGF